MFNNKKTEIVIVGAGPVGMMSALVLNRKGIDVMLIDEAERIGTRSNATVLHPGTLSLLHRWGLLERVMDTAYRIDHLKIYDGKQAKADLAFGSINAAFPFAASIPQTTLEVILERELEREGIPIIWNTKAVECDETESGVEIKAQHFSDQSLGYAVSRMERMIDKEITIRAKVAIASDGCHSLMRKRLHLRKLQGDTPEFFIIFDFVSDTDSEHTMRFSLDGDLATAQTPISSDVSRLTFQFKGLELPNDFRIKSRDPLQGQFEPVELLEDSHLKELIGTHVPWNPGYIERILWRVAVPFERSFAENMMLHNTILLGDAARTFEPISAASLNLGLVEAEKVASVLADFVGEAQLGARIADLSNEFAIDWQMRYNAEPYAVTRRETDDWIALNRRRIVPCIPASGPDLDQLAELLALRLELPHPAHA